MCEDDPGCPCGARRIPVSGAMVRVDVELGPAYRAGLDTLELVDRLANLLPRECADDRAELKSRAIALTEVMLEGLANSKPPPGGG